MPRLKVSDYDGKIDWREVIGLERLNSMMQNDVSKSMVRYWRTTKDQAATIMFSGGDYHEGELALRRHLAQISGENPNQAAQAQMDQQKTISNVAEDNAETFGNIEMDRMDSESKILSDNEDSFNAAKHIDMENHMGGKAKQDVNNLSLQEVNQVTSAEHLNITEKTHNIQMSMPMSETVIQEHSLGNPIHHRNEVGSESELLGGLDLKTYNSN